MNNRSFRLVLMLVLFSVFITAISNPAQAAPPPSPRISIEPSHVIANFSNEIIVSLDNINSSSPGYFFLNMTIPAGYNFTMPTAKGRTVGNYTMINTTTDANQVMINITSNTTNTVDVTYSLNYGATTGTSLGQPITNMKIGASTFNLTAPTPTTNGYINISLGGTAGPVLPQDKVKVRLAKGILTNPNPGTTTDYTWFLQATNSPTGTADNAVAVVEVISVPGVSVSENTQTFQTFNSSIPANATLQLPSGNLTVNLTTTNTSLNVTNFDITLQDFTGDPVPNEKKGVESLSRFMFIGIDAPTLNGTTFTAFITVNYSSIIQSLTIPEANLRLYHLNGSTGIWELTSGSGVDTVNKIVFGNVTGFSIFGVMGARAAPSGNTVGSGGGGGVVSNGNIANIKKNESQSNIVTTNAVMSTATPVLEVTQSATATLGVTGASSASAPPVNFALILGLGIIIALIVVLYIVRREISKK